MTFFTILIFAYLLGSIPWGYIIAMFYGINIRKVGSGNIGGTNVSRALGLPIGIAVAVLDLLKGVIAASIAIFSLNSHTQIAMVILAVILGHIFSIYMKFKGGKGVATAFGAFTVLIGWQASLFLVALWILIVAFTRLVSLASLIIVLLLPLFFVIVKPDIAYLILSLIVTSLIYWTHRQNIDRLTHGKELQLDIHVGLKRHRKKTRLRAAKELE